MISQDVYETLKGWIASCESYLNTLVEPTTGEGESEPPLIQDPYRRKVSDKLDAIEAQLEKLEVLVEALLERKATPKRHWWHRNDKRLKGSGQPAAHE